MNRREFITLCVWLVTANSLQNTLKAETLDKLMKYLDNNNNNNTNSWITNVKKGTEEMKRISKNDKMEEDKKQVLIDWIATYLFFRFVAPTFLSWEPEKSLWRTLPIIIAWYNASNEESKKLFIEEMQEAGVSVAEMWLILHIIQWSMFDYEKVLEWKVLKNFSKDIDSFISNPLINKKLEKLWIDIDKDDWKKEYLYFDEDNKKIIISKDIFLEIIPYILKKYKINNIIDIILDYVFVKQQEDQIREILKNRIAKNNKSTKNTQWYNVEEENKKQNIEINNKLTDIIEYEIHELAWFFLINQPLFWVWLVSTSNDKIQQVSNKIKYLAISNWMTVEDAENLQRRFIWKIINFLPNRFAFLSDLWPFAAALKIWGVGWVVTLVDSMLPIVIANIKPFFKDIHQILLEANEHFKPKEIDFLNPKALWNYWEKHIVWNLSILKDILVMLITKSLPQISWLSKVKKYIQNTWKNNEWETIEEWVKTDIQSWMRIREFWKNYSREKINSIPKNKNVLSDIDKNLAKMNNTTDIIKNNSNWFENIIDIVWYLASYSNSIEEKDVEKNKILEILQKHKSLFKKLYNQTEIQYSNNDNLKFINEFLEKYFKWSVKINKKEIKEFLDKGLDSLINYLKNKGQNENISKKQIYGLLWDFSYNLELSLTPNIYKDWSVKWLSDAIETNLIFINKIKQSTDFPKDIKHKIEENFIWNLISSEIHSKNKYYKLKKGWKIQTALKILTHKLWKNKMEYLITLMSNFLKEYNNINWQYLKAINNIIHEIKNTEEDVAQTKDYEESKKIFEKNKGFFSKILWNWYYYDTFEKFIEEWEKKLWKDIYEIVQMILLIQSPFIISISESIKRVINSSNLTNDYMKEYIIWLWSYFISMFADNFVWLVVWAKLVKDILWVWEDKSIEMMWKFAVYWGTQIVTGNSPNVLIKWEYGLNFYSEKYLKTEIQKEKEVLDKKNWQELFYKMFWWKTEEENKKIQKEFNGVLKQLENILWTVLITAGWNYKSVLYDTLSLLMIRWSLSDIVGVKLNKDEFILTMAWLTMQYWKIF